MSSPFLPDSTRPPSRPAPARPLRHSAFGLLSSFLLFALPALAGLTTPNNDFTAGPPETLGPSSRRTQIVLSEIMYRPATRPDGRNVEFIEIFNGNPWFHDVSGHRLSGDIAYTFPPNTTLPASGFLVIAAAPADVSTVYGLPNVLGPYTNSLKTSGLIRLHDEQGTILLEVAYTRDDPWPMGADGSGHSIVLARPSYGEGDPRAWERSDIVGGSPGAHEIFRASPLRQVVLNEVLAHTDLPELDSIELYNHSNAAADLSGCVLSDDALLNKFVIPTNTFIPARGFLALTETQLGFGLSAAGETVYLKNPDGSRVLDALRFAAQENGIAFGRSPDGAGRWHRLQDQTFGTNNAAPRLSDIVINELMYHPITNDDDDQYIELHNRGSAAVSLAGWKLTDGISYTFPASTLLAPGGYLVVAANAARLRSNYAQLNTTNCLGNFSGRLSGGGERIALAIPDALVSTNASGFPVTNWMDIVVDEVTYADGGRWGVWADGGGSSLELIDPRADRRLAANWGDSDESAKSSWTTIETTGELGLGSNYSSQSVAHGQLGLLDAGECLVDDVEVRPGAGGNNYVANPNFNASLANWSLQGAFMRSSLNATQGFGGGAALHLRTYNRLFTLANYAQCALTNTTLASGATATLRLKGRWLRGSPDIVFRLPGNWLEAAGRLTVPANLGTPGLRNSRFVTNAPPALYDVTHAPTLPAAGQPVVVTARVRDPDGLASFNLLFRLDPSLNYISYVMRDDGLGGDAIAGDGLYSATLPARPAGATLPFMLQAADMLGAAATFPEALPDHSPTRECVVRWGDLNPAGSLGVYHLWLTQTNVSRWMAQATVGNEEMDATFVYRGRVIYNASARYSGSPYHQAVDGPAGTRACHYIWSMPKDDQFLGESAFNKIAWPGNDIQDDTISANNNDSTLQREQAANTLLRGLGVPWISRRYVIVYVNGVRRGQVMEDALRPSGSVPEAYYPEDTGGYLFKIQPWFEGAFVPDGSGTVGFQNKSWAIVAPYRSGGVYKPARYRWHYQAREVPEAASDFTQVWTLLDAMNAYNDPNYPQILNGVIDVDQWLRVVAANHAAGNWDCYGVQNGQNVFGYVSAQRRWQLFMFDFNIVLGNRIAWAPGANLETTQETAWERMYGTSGHPQLRRLYWRALKELATGPMMPAKANPLLDAKYAGLQANGIAAASPQPIKDWIATARLSIATQVATRDTPSFTLTAGPVTTGSNSVSLSGTAPLEVDSITVGGVVAQVRWTSTTGWTLTVPVPSGTNVLTILGYDRNGNLMPGVSNVITVVSTAVPEPPTGRVVINEIMHRPALDGAEYVEFFNAATNTTYDLGGWQVNGLGYTFPAGTFLAPQRPLVLARSQMLFANAYGASNLVAGVFGGNLQTDGETLTLFDSLGAVVNRVRYETNAPWPAGALTPGTSLQLRDVRQDNSRVGNWAVGQTNATAPPPQWVFYSTNLVASSSSRLYLYLQSAGELYLDDLALVAGTVPGAGANLLTNPGFESNLGTAWARVGNHSSSARNTSVRRTGNASLQMLATGAGSGSANSVYQDTAATLTAGATYTVSLWYLQSTNAGNAATRFSSGAVTAVFNVTAPTTSSSLVLTPGAPNSVATNLPPFPTLWLNEVQPQNLSGPTDNFGERDPWVEIYNSGSTTQSLAGLYLGTNYASPAQWAFPTNATLGPGQFRLVWLDGQPAQSNATALHASLRPGGDNGSLALSRLVGNQVQVVDYLNYAALPANYSFGDVPDGQPFYRRAMYRASPGGTNDASLPPITVFINEWMAANTGFSTDPATGNYDDWFELYNPSVTPAELGGYYLTDNLGNPTKYRIPAGYRVPPGGYLLVWADEATSANSTNDPALHVNFKLSKDGESLGLFAPDGSPVDVVVFGEQLDNVSEGRIPDGGSLRLLLPAPTPLAANVPPPAEGPPNVTGMTWIPGGEVSLSFATSPGHTYRVAFKDDLNAPVWQPLGENRFATTTSLTVTDPGGGSQRFYRVALLD